jgi:hypothetical protein
LPNIRILQFIEYDSHTDTGKIYSGIMDENVVKADEITLSRLNISNMIFHEFMKKAKKVGGGVNNWINDEVFQRVENLTIIKYAENSIESQIYNNIARDLQYQIKMNMSDHLTRDQFNKCWIEKINRKLQELRKEME